MNVNDCIDLILEFEGGYVNNPNDPGGETKYGICKRARPHLDIKNLTLSQAREIYRAEYWNPTASRIYDIAPRLALAVFDSAVNQGAGFAVQALQAVVCSRQDGVIGRSTISDLQDALADRGEDSLVSQYMTARMMRYTRISGWKHFGHGWTRRMFDLAMHLGAEGKV